jgi:hypothetical protein
MTSTLVAQASLERYVRDHKAWLYVALRGMQEQLQQHERTTLGDIAWYVVNNHAFKQAMPEYRMALHISTAFRLGAFRDAGLIIGRGTGIRFRAGSQVSSPTLLKKKVKKSKRSQHRRRLAA